MGLLNPGKFEEDDSSIASAPAAQATPAKTSPTSSPSANKGTSRMATNPNIPTTKVTTGVIRGSYVKIFKAELPKNAPPGAEPKFSMTLLISKDDTVTLEKIAKAQQTAVALKWPNKAPAKIHTTLHDGDEPRESNGEAYGDECKGHMVMTVSSKYKPRCIDRDGNEIIDPSQVGSGDYFKASINFYGYSAQGKNGVSAGLNNLLFWEKGISLGGQGSCEEDFAEDLNR